MKAYIRWYDQYQNPPHTPYVEVDLSDDSGNIGDESCLPDGFFWSNGHTFIYPRKVVGDHPLKFAQNLRDTLLCKGVNITGLQRRYID